jgi:hypothetical protein
MEHLPSFLAQVVGPALRYELSLLVGFALILIVRERFYTYLARRSKTSHT